jgi:hypothetical protein
MSVDYNDWTGIFTPVDTGDTARIGVSSAGTIDVFDGGIFTCLGGYIGRDNNGTLNVRVGGETYWNGETFAPEEGDSWLAHLNVYGTAYIEQLKMYGSLDTLTIIGNGVDAAILTIVEGLLGKISDANIIINANGIMRITGGWGSAYKIDGDAIGTDSYIDLVGGTLKVNDGITESNYVPHLIGYGGTGVVNSAAGTGPDAGFTIFTAELPGSPLNRLTIPSGKRLSLATNRITIK